MPDNNTPSHRPQRGNITSLKFHTTDAEVLNDTELLGHEFVGRSATAEERTKALSIGREMNAGTMPEMSLTPRRLFGAPKP
jgi:hypothetical protein